MLIILVIILCIIGYFIYTKVSNTNDIQNILLKEKVLSYVKDKIINDEELVVKDKNNKIYTIKIALLKLDSFFREKFELEGWTTLTGVRLPLVSDFGTFYCSKRSNGKVCDKILVYEKHTQKHRIVNIEEYYCDENNNRFMLSSDFYFI